MFKDFIRAFAFTGLCCLPVASQALPAVGLTQDESVRDFIQEMTDKYDFDRLVLESLFEQAEVKESILKAIASPYEAKPWHAYRPLFVTESHIQKGVEFWKAHKSILSKAEKQYGVPPEMVVAILGIETRYGKVTGNYRVLDALSTLAFSYPPRASFFKKELEEFLLMVQEENLDPYTLKGSYAGAIGAPQFIPSSYRHYAVDFSNSGQRNLFDDMTDVIGSVANYFAVHGWEKDAPIAKPVSISSDAESLATLISPRNNPKPKLSGKALKSQGVMLDGDLLDEKLALISLEGEAEPDYWIGFNNFYVITRYNHSNMYAMAAYQLAEAIKERYHS